MRPLAHQENLNYSYRWNFYWLNVFYVVEPCKRFFYLNFSLFQVKFSKKFFFQEKKLNIIIINSIDKLIWV